MSGTKKKGNISQRREMLDYTKELQEGKGAASRGREGHTWGFFFF